MEKVGDAMMAGPVLRAGEVTDALIDALQEDNPGKELRVRDASGYVRVEGPGGLTLTRKTIEYMLGRKFSMQEIEIHMTGFSLGFPVMTMAGTLSPCMRRHCRSPTPSIPGSLPHGRAK